jgi:hypothetical protein
VEVLRAKQQTLELLADGEAHRSVWLIRRFLETEGVPSEGHNERLLIANNEDIPAVVVADHPVISRHRLYAAAVEAVAEIEAQGLIVGARAERQDEANYPPLTSVDAVSYQLGGMGTAVRGLEEGLAELKGGYRLVHGFRERGAWFLDIDVFTADTADLGLDPRTRRCLEEALAAYRRGLYLAAASLLAAAIEGAWYAVGERLSLSDPRIRQALDGDNTAKLQRLVSERLGAQGAELLAHGSLMRELRNYGVHPRGTESAGLENYFTEEACGLLLLEAPRYMRLLIQAMS